MTTKQLFNHLKELSVDSPVFFFFFSPMLFYQGGQRQPEAVFQLCPGHTNHNISRLAAGWLGLGYVSCPRKHSSILLLLFFHSTSEAES